MATGNPSAVLQMPAPRFTRIARSLSVFRDGIVEKEKMEEAAAEERAQRRAVQDKAVDALGTGLARLSEGDLTAHISDELGEGYDRLRIDFNRTLDTLNDTVGQVINTSSSIRNGASEISQASQDLSHRTESQAATLEETAAALDEMTASVTSAGHVISMITRRNALWRISSVTPISSRPICSRPRAPGPRYACRLVRKSWRNLHRASLQRRMAPP